MYLLTFWLRVSKSPKVIWLYIENLPTAIQFQIYQQISMHFHWSMVRYYKELTENAKTSRNVVQQTVHE